MTKIIRHDDWLNSKWWEEDVRGVFTIHEVQEVDDKQDYSSVNEVLAAAKQKANTLGKRVYIMQCIGYADPNESR